MYKNIRLIVVVITLVMILSGCDDSSVKYYTSDDDVSSGDTTATATTAGLEADSEQAYELDEQNSDEMVPVYVCGAVVNPGVYYLSSTALKDEALLAAGGYDVGADEGYVNLAETIASGEKIYFPYEGECEAAIGISPDDNGEKSDKIDINTATKEELMTLPGIGESKAEAIISYREEYGPFQSVGEITNITGIKEGVYNNIKDYITVY